MGGFQGMYKCMCICVCLCVCKFVHVHMCSVTCAWRCVCLCVQANTEARGWHWETSLITPSKHTLTLAELANAVILLVSLLQGSPSVFWALRLQADYMTMQCLWGFWESERWSSHLCGKCLAASCHPSSWEFYVCRFPNLRLVGPVHIFIPT